MKALLKLPVVLYVTVDRQEARARSIWGWTLLGQWPGGLLHCVGRSLVLFGPPEGGVGGRGELPSPPGLPAEELPGGVPRGGLEVTRKPASPSQLAPLWCLEGL